MQERAYFYSIMKLLVGVTDNLMWGFRTQYLDHALTEQAARSKD